MKEYEVGQLLTAEDVDMLLSDQSEEVRTSTAKKVAQTFTLTDLNPNEKEIAEAIFRIMLSDTAVAVRKTLSENLKDNKEVPHDVVVKMASDVDEVAIPVIGSSPVLTDDDLIDIIHSQSETKQVAVASRETVSEKVTSVIAAEGVERAVAVMVGNQGAEVSEQSLTTVLDRFKDSEIVKQPMVLRNKLPLVVVERLISLVSDRMKEHLVGKYNISEDVASKITDESREKVTVSVSYMAKDTEVQSLVEQLSSENKLTPSIIFRSLCTGDVKFFEYSMAKLTGLPVHNVRILIYDSGDLGLKGLFTKAHLPGILFPAIKAAIEVFLETPIDDTDAGLEKFRRKVAERVLSKLDNSGITLQDADVNYILDKIDGLPPSFMEVL